MRTNRAFHHAFQRSDAHSIGLMIVVDLPKDDHLVNFLVGTLRYELLHAQFCVVVKVLLNNGVETFSYDMH